jgi:histidyl-tRNA synthetase
MSTFQSLPGFREFYPEDCAARNALFQAWRAAARRHGFVEYDAPLLEPLELFTEKSGEEIRAQLFEFTDKGGRPVALRPEMTPSLARLVAARAGSLRKPIKWFSLGEQFRYEKPQKGRLRSFYQFNADILGEPGPGADAECIALLIESLKACGLKDGEFEIRISDRKLWFLFLAAKGINEEQAIKALAIIDKWQREPKEEILKKLVTLFGDQAESLWNQINTLLLENQVSAIIGFLSSGLIESSPALTQRMKDWEELQKMLQGLGLGKIFRIDLSIVRGLAYYTGFVFEAFQTVGTARALAGGGRYDNLIQKLGGVDLPAVGFAIGDVTVTDLLQELKRPLGEVDKPDVYIVIGGEKERAPALQLAAQLRAAGLAVDYPLKDEKFGKQFKAADQCGARLALILGPDEVANGQVKIKDMQSGTEAPFANDATLLPKIRDILANGLPATNG